MKSRLAFSNGSEFAIWQDSWCSRCKKDEEYRLLEQNGCEILAVAVMSDEEIPEWEPDPNVKGWPNVICSAFVGPQSRNPPSQGLGRDTQRTKDG